MSLGIIKNKAKKLLYIEIYHKLGIFSYNNIIEKKIIVCRLIVFYSFSCKK